MQEENGFAVFISRSTRCRTTPPPRAASRSAATTRRPLFRHRRRRFSRGSKNIVRFPSLVQVLECLERCANGYVPTDLKRELIGHQVRDEITELNSPTALHRFGAPFKSEFGEVAPVDSELPILRYIFVHHVRNFPFLDQAREQEFWQNKLQIVRSLSIFERGDVD